MDKLQEIYEHCIIMEKSIFTFFKENYYEQCDVPSIESILMFIRKIKFDERNEIDNLLEILDEKNLDKIKKRTFKIIETLRDKDINKIMIILNRVHFPVFGFEYINKKQGPIIPAVKADKALQG